MTGTQFGEVPTHAKEDAEDSWWSGQHSYWLVNETLPKALNNHAPEGYFFGRNPDNESDFGFWEKEGQ